MAMNLRIKAMEENRVKLIAAAR
ncbi:MAG TPA: TetR family transcriptional regulator, partial [Ochrobactrum anthropi]|nr:TetR family transcriptional regulator [Brucella anthropi]